MQTCNWTLFLSPNSKIQALSQPGPKNILKGGICHELDIENKAKDKKKMKLSYINLNSSQVQIFRKTHVQTSYKPKTGSIYNSSVMYSNKVVY